MLHALAQDIKHKQKNLDLGHENMFRELVQEHMFESFIQPKCCKNIKRSDRQHSTVIAKVKADDINADPVLPYLNKISSYTIHGGSHMNFELSNEPNDLLGAIFWQLKRIKIETYNPICIGTIIESTEEHQAHEETKNDDKMTGKGSTGNFQYIKEYNRLVE